MRKPNGRQFRKVEPRASTLIESMRDIGYSLQTAVADVIDNSITAEATRIDLLADTHSDIPSFGILDDGWGMTEDELIEAMRPGTRSPLETRSDHDLGRFGLGLKTASFSQCRRLIVLTRKAGETSCAIWDLDTVAETDQWVVELTKQFEDVPWQGRLGEKGTLVVWQKLDRLVDSDTADDRRNLVRQIDETGSHVELVFHRYLAGEPGLKRIQMSLNDRKLKAFDPFNSRHPATQFGPEEIFRLGDQEIRIQAVTLPHHSKVSDADWRRYGGPEGYVANQGFYVYREKRLIIHGTWFNLARQTELTKLSRVRIDMPNGMDAEWKIDVKKASAQPPAPVRDRLRRIIEQIGATSKRVYTTRGRRLTSDNQLPVWSRVQDKGFISYTVNKDHPAFETFRARLPDELTGELEKLLELISSALPIDALFTDVSSNPESVAVHGISEQDLAEIARTTYLKLQSIGQTHEDIELMMSSAEPFRSNWTATSRVLEGIERERTSNVQ
jgi:hypothetical protein